MKFYIITADYRQLSAQSPKYAFCAAEKTTVSAAKRRFCNKFLGLPYVQVQELTAEEMEKHPLFKWIAWL